MPQLYSAGELFTIIKMLGAKDIEDFGDDEGQKNAVYYFMNIEMMKLAKLVEKVVYSESKSLSADGYVTFQQSGVDINDIFEPKTILYTEAGVLKELPHRTSDVAPQGWWRESQNNEIHIRGFGSVTGQNPRPLPSTTYQLKYIKYPSKVTVDGSMVDIPPSGYSELIHGVLRLIKYAKNSYGGADFMDQKAKSEYNNLVQGTISGRGTGNTGQATGINDATVAKG